MVVKTGVVRHGINDFFGYCRRGGWCNWTLSAGMISGHAFVAFEQISEVYDRYQKSEKADIKDRIKEIIPTPLALCAVANTALAIYYFAMRSYFSPLNFIVSFVCSLVSLKIMERLNWETFGRIFDTSDNPKLDAAIKRCNEVFAKDSKETDFVGLKESLLSLGLPDREVFVSREYDKLQVHGTSVGMEEGVYFSDKMTIGEIIESLDSVAASRGSDGAESEAKIKEYNEIVDALKNPQTEDGKLDYNRLLVDLGEIKEGLQASDFLTEVESLEAAVSNLLTFREAAHEYNELIGSADSFCEEENCRTNAFCDEIQGIIGRIKEISEPYAIKLRKKMLAVQKKATRHYTEHNTRLEVAKILEKARPAYKKIIGDIREYLAENCNGEKTDFEALKTEIGKVKDLFGALSPEFILEGKKRRKIAKEVEEEGEENHTKEPKIITTGEICQRIERLENRVTERAELRDAIKNYNGLIEEVNSISVNEEPVLAYPEGLIDKILRVRKQFEPLQGLFVYAVSNEDVGDLECCKSKLECGEVQEGTKIGTTAVISSFDSIIVGTCSMVLENVVERASEIRQKFDPDDDELSGGYEDPDLEKLQAEITKLIEPNFHGVLAASKHLTKVQKRFDISTFADEAIELLNVTKQAIENRIKEGAEPEQESEGE